MYGILKSAHDVPATQLLWEQYDPPPHMHCQYYTICLQGLPGFYP